VKNIKGFTLTELLVVILIIGIISAIAIPKFIFAANKTKYMRVLNFAQSISSAQERYYLANDKYARDLTTELDISLPASCAFEPHDNWSYDLFFCSDFWIHNGKDYGYLRIYPQKNKTSPSAYQIPYKHSHIISGRSPTCVPETNGEEFCLKLGTVKETDAWGYKYYF
jgi:prepilin-type N-terminal cleavage/methylation domain-containing protein